MLPEIHANVSLKNKNWFKTGGSARFYAEPQTVAEFQTLIAYAQTQSLEILLLGQGANMLISDEGFDGLVIHPKLCDITYHKPCPDTQTIHVTAGAGVTIAQLIESCLDHNVLGLEEFSGIPGTVGGSVYINLHYYEFLLSQFVHSAVIINKQTNSLETVSFDWFEFGYNNSKLLQESYYLVSATFALRFASHDEVMYARGRRTEIIRHRERRYPYKNTCGSFFRNFYPDEVSLELHGKKMIYIAYYLDKIGIKGVLMCGNASVSHQHANMIVTTDSATSSDVISLARQMQQLVYTHYGIIPQPECRLVGFIKYPLLNDF